MKQCDYGCGGEGKFYFPGVKRWCCKEKANQCDAVRKKVSANKIGVKQPNKVGMTVVHNTKPCPICGKHITVANFLKHTQSCGVMHTHSCVHCGKEWNDKHKTAKRKYCSDECKTIHVSNISSAAMLDKYANGGLIPYGGGMKRYMYDKIDGSSLKVQGMYEFRTCAILDQKVVNGDIHHWEYTVDGIRYADEVGKMRTYFPDFKVYQTSDEFYYLETKGFKVLRDEFKWAAVISQGFKLVVWFGDDILIHEVDKD